MQNLKKLLTPKLTDYIIHTPTPKQQAFLFLETYDVFYGGAAGGGKILANDGIILTPFGWKKGIDLKVGDLVNNPNGSIQRIIQIKPEISIDKWIVHFSDKTYTEVAEEHLWKAWKGSKSRKIKNKRIFGEDSAEIIETKEIAEWINRGYKPQIPVCEEQPFNITSKEKNIIDPYLMGVLLGDGCLTRSNIMVSCSEKDKQHYKEIFGNLDINFSLYQCFSFLGQRNKNLKTKLKSYNLLNTKSNNKFIPNNYKYGNIETRKNIVKGLMDTDGFSSKNKKACYYYSVSKDLADDMAFILRSLGAVVTITDKIGQYRDKNGKIVKCSKCYKLYIKSRNPDDLFCMKRKQNGNFGKNNISKNIIKIEIKGKIKGRCITVSNPNGLYITNDFIVTHNSDALLMAALQYVDIPNYSAILFRDTYTNLTVPGALLDRAHAWLDNTDAHWSGDKKYFIFPSGAKISFGHLSSPKSHFNYQSAEFQFIGFDEAGNIRWNQIRYLYSRLRKLKGHNVPLRMRMASNPGGISHDDLKAWYIDKETRGKRIFIPAWIDDNPYLDKEEYFKSLDNLDPLTNEQLKKGNWDAQTTGEMFDKTWFKIVDDIPGKIIKSVRFWDLAATAKTEDNDPAYTVGIRINKLNNGLFIIDDIIRFRGDPAKVDNTVKSIAMSDGKSVAIRMEMEGGSSGKMVISNFARKILVGYNFEGKTPSGSKIERARPVATQAKYGNILLLRAGWNKDFLDEMHRFPLAKFKDQVDATSGGFNYLNFSGNAKARIV